MGISNDPIVKGENVQMSQQLRGQSIIYHILFYFFFFFEKPNPKVNIIAKEEKKSDYKGQ